MSNTNSIDTNISHYSLAELMAIVQLNELQPNEITKETNKYINKFKKSNPPLSTFFLEIQSQLLQYSSNLVDPKNPEASFVEGFSTINDDSNQNDSDAQYPAGQSQQDNWYQNQALPQDDDQNQSDKTTQRKQKIDVYGNDHVPMNRDQLGVNNNYTVPVSQDSLNPNLKNTITRFVNLDSQFRQFSNGSDSSSTDYTLDLSDPLTNALSIRLYSYQIPYSWYVIDIPYGNTCFWISDISNNINIPITVSPGNYNPTQLTTTLNDILIKLFSNLTNPVEYNTNNGKLTFNLNGGIYSGGLINGIDINPFIIDSTTILLFFDQTAKLQCDTNCVNKSYYLNQTLGWIMGFRFSYIYVDPSGNTGSGIVDLNGTKYLILVIDDYNQNHVNNGLVSITEYSNVLKMPSYYSADLTYTCLNATNTSNMKSNINTDTLFLSGKQNIEYSKTQLVVPSAPRTLTTSQIYTINEINKNRNNNTNYRAKAPTSPDILAMIPIKTSGLSTGGLIVEFAGSLQDNIRTYFGPVNIDRMRVKLLNDKGNVINLNGADWCVTLIIECLYQY
jgi:hypothetical protein